MPDGEGNPTDGDAKKLAKQIEELENYGRKTGEIVEGRVLELKRSLYDITGRI